MINNENMRKANKIRIETVIKGLEKRGIKGYYAEDGEEALRMLLEMMPEGSSVGRGGSMTLNELGVFEELQKRNYTCYEPHSEKDPDRIIEVRLAIFSADFMLTSANASTLDGEIINIDGTGNRLAPIIYGPDKVIFIVGANKIAADVHDAYKRVRCDACPPNCVRLGKKTPCAITGKCGDCMSPGNTVCCNLNTTRYNSIPDRMHVILINDNLGF